MFVEMKKILNAYRTHTAYPSYNFKRYNNFKELRIQQMSNNLSNYLHSKGVPQKGGKAFLLIGKQISYGLKTQFNGESVSKLFKMADTNGDNGIDSGEFAIVLQVIEYLSGNGKPAHSKNGHYNLTSNTGNKKHDNLINKMARGMKSKGVKNALIAGFIGAGATAAVGAVAYTVHRATHRRNHRSHGGGILGGALNMGSQIVGSLGGLFSSIKNSK
jgi:hypothetical protein